MKNKTMSKLDSSLDILREISRIMNEEQMDDRRAVQMVIDRLDVYAIHAFYAGLSPEFEKLSDEDDNIWDLIEDAADILEL